MIFGFTIRDGRVVEIELAADAERLERSVVEDTGVAGLSGVCTKKSG